jgi:cytochrome oxidase assembly protein ShyY1
VLISLALRCWQLSRLVNIMKIMVEVNTIEISASVDWLG